MGRLNIGLLVVLLSMAVHSVKAQDFSGTPSRIQSAYLWFERFVLKVNMVRLNIYRTELTGTVIIEPMEEYARRDGTSISDARYTYMILRFQNQYYCTRWSATDDHSGRSVQYQRSTSPVGRSAINDCPSLGTYPGSAVVLIKLTTPLGENVPVILNSTTGNCGIPIGEYTGTVSDPSCSNAENRLVVASGGLTITSDCGIPVEPPVLNDPLWCVNSGGPEEIMDQDGAPKFVILAYGVGLARKFICARFVQISTTRVEMSFMVLAAGQPARVLQCEHAFDQTTTGTQTVLDELLGTPLTYTGYNWGLKLLTCVTDNPCDNGNCMMDANYLRVCVCSPGFTGLYCSTNIDDCPNSCGNGFCQDLINDYNCICNSGWTGQFCNVPLFCSSRPCLNNGVCSELDSGFKCTCPRLYSGERCEITPCTLGPCRNGGACSVDLFEDTGFQCGCPPGFTGDRCETQIYCYSSPCINGGTCFETGNDYFCDCLAGYQGKNCEQEAYCERQPCGSGGVCYEISNDYTCTCFPGYTGRDCDIVEVCHSSPCENGATCYEAPGLSYSCDCMWGFTGTKCETKLHCEPNPCDHGTCFNLDNDYECRCYPGFQGRNCDQEDHCYRQPCLYGGTCISTQGSFICLCTPEYNGAYCQNEKACNPNPCENNGYCQVGTNQEEICICQDGFTGRFCERPPPPNPCEANPCSYGECMPYGEKFVCDCFEDWTGEFCDEREGCDPKCRNGGECEITIFGNQCDCPPDFTGSICETPIPVHPCDRRNPCEHGGTCIPMGDDLKCLCSEGFEGRLCQNVVNKCMPNPCRHGGTCQERVGGYACACPVAYTGPQCEDAKCDGVGCKNGGTCVPQEDYQRPTVCKCPSGFKGRYCEDEDGCSSRPCMNGGACSMEDGNYHCRCPPPFGGPQCQHTQCPCLNGGYCSPQRPGKCTCPDGYEGDLCEDEIEDMFDYTALIIILVVLFILALIVVACLCIVCRRMKKKEEVVEVCAEPTPVKKEIMVAAAAKPQIRVVQMAPKAAAPQVLKAVALPQSGPLTLAAPPPNMTGAVFSPNIRPFGAANVIYGDPTYGTSALRPLNPLTLQ